MYLAVLLMYFISAALILLASLALIVYVSVPYNKTGRTSVWYSFILVFLRVFLWSKHIIIIIIIIPKQHLSVGLCHGDGMFSVT